MYVLPGQIPVASAPQFRNIPISATTPDVSHPYKKMAFLKMYISDTKKYTGLLSFTT